RCRHDRRGGRRQRRAPAAAADHRRYGDRRGRATPRRRLCGAAGQAAGSTGGNWLMARHFLDIRDFDAVTLHNTLSEGIRLKAARPQMRGQGGPLAGRALAMVFDNPSTRTRVSFDIAMRELGGETLMLT